MPGGGAGIGSTLAATEGPDSGALAGLVPAHAGMAGAERADAGHLSGHVLNAILTRLEGSDVPAIAGTFAAVATVAVHDGPDVPVCSAAFTAGILSATEGHDSGSMSGHFAAVATMARTEGHDLASLSEMAAYAGHLTGAEGRDSGSSGGAVTASATMAVREGHDLDAAAGSIVLAAGLAATGGRDVPALHGVAYPIPPGLKVREGPDVAALAGLVAGSGYHLYGSDGLGDPIDYGTPIGETAATSWTVGIPGAGSWSFGVRAFGPPGEEENLDCALTIVLDSLGNDITNRPAAPYGLRAVPIAAGGIRAEWWSPVVKGPKAPTGFNVFVGPGSPDYGSPAATVAASAGFRGVYWCDLSSPGVPGAYAVGVRAYNASGSEQNTGSVPVTTTNAGPLSVSGLAATAIV